MLPSIAEIVLITINPVNIQPFSEEIGENSLSEKSTKWCFSFFLYVFQINYKFKFGLNKKGPFAVKRPFLKLKIYCTNSISTFTQLIAGCFEYFFSITMFICINPYDVKARIYFAKIYSILEIFGHMLYYLSGDIKYCNFMNFFICLNI